MTDRSPLWPGGGEGGQAYLTLVGPHRYGSDGGDATLGSAIGEQARPPARPPVCVFVQLH